MIQIYDAVVGDTTITANRSLYVDFTIPYTDLGVGTIVKDDNRRNMWWFLQPLDTRLWVATTCSFFVIGATIWLIEHPMNEEFQGPWHDVVGSVLWFSFSTLTFSHSNISFFPFLTFSNFPNWDSIRGVWLCILKLITKLNYMALINYLIIMTSRSNN